MQTRLFLFLLLLGNALIVSSAWAGQTCDTQSYPMSTHAEQFKDNGDGTLTDNQSKLIWMRCSMGQVWSGATCTGAPRTYTWQSAKDEAVKLNLKGGYAGHSDWRVPQIFELAMIVERQCSNPRTNLELFPETPANYFWTATEPADPGKGYVLSFGAEGAVYKNRGEALDVRLVRGGKPR
jgi:hypothetical protein